MKEKGLLVPWSSEDHDTGEEDVEEDREEARRILRKKRFNMELLTAIIDPYRTRDEVIEEVKRCLNNGASSNSRCQEELASGCHLAAIFGEVDVARILLEAGADGAARDKVGRQPHHIAAARGHLSAIVLFITAFPHLIDSQVAPEMNIEIQDEHLDSDIHNHSEISLQLPLITEGSTALHIASRFGYIDIVDFLLENHAKTDIKDNELQTALDVAGIDADYSRPGTIVGAAIPAEELALQDESFPSMRQKESKPYLMTLLPGKKKKKEISQIMELFTSFYKTGVTLSKTDLKDKKVTLLHTAVRKEDIQAIRALIQRGFQINTLDDKERTPVHLAVELHLLESLNILLESDESAVNYRDGKGRTPLHLAVEYEWMKGVQTLLEQKTDLKIVSKNGESVLHVAARKGNVQLLKILLERFSTKVIHRRDNDGFTPLFRAVEKGTPDCVDLLLQNTKDPNFKMYIKKATDMTPSATLLHMAVKSNSPQVLDRIISLLRPSDTYLNFWNHKGYTALHLAAKRGYKECAQILLSTPGTIIDMLSDNEERTALHFAAESGSCEIIKMILEECTHYDINMLNAADIDGREPLILAVNGSHRECAMLLLSRGANLAAKDGQAGLTALELIFHKLSHPVPLLEDLLDSFMVREVETEKQKEDSPELEIKMDFTILLADGRNSSRQLGVIDAINNSAYHQLQQRLFLHPLIETFLYLKWRQLKYFFKILVFIYIIHILSLTGVAMMTYAYHIPVMAWICRVIVLMTLIPAICWELLNASRFERFYLLDGETWLKWAVIFTTGLVIILPELHWARYLTSLSVLLAWIELLFLYAKTFTWGLIVQMFFEVAKNVVEVLTTFIFLILGFAFAFMVLFDERYPFKNIWTSICKVLVMMVELDYNTAFNEDEDREVTTFNVLGRLMYIGFMILVVMVLINLIQSMSVNDVAKLEAQGRSKRQAKKASFLSLLESFCYNERFLAWLPRFAQEKIENKRSVPNKIYVLPNKPTGPNNPLPDKLRSSILQTVFDRNVPLETDTLNNKVDQLVSDVEKIYDMIRDIKHSLKRFQDQS